MYDGSTNVAVQLNSSGIALVTPPSNVSIDGKPFEIKVAGNISYVDTTNTPTVVLGLGSSVPPIAQLVSMSTGSTGGTIPFQIMANLIWAADANRIAGWAQSYAYQHSYVNQSIFVNSVSSQSDLQFCVIGESGGSTFSTDATITLTEFSLSFE